jgi:hypothetical protein
MVNAAAETDAQVVRISMDAKATVKVGDFSRGGKKRVRVKAADHDFTPSARVTPIGADLSTVCPPPCSLGATGLHPDALFALAMPTLACMTAHIAS